MLMTLCAINVDCNITSRKQMACA